jgi:proteasome lid subunit RPN8/RPN11
MTALQIKIIEALEAGELGRVRELQALYRSSIMENAGRGGPELPCRVIEKKQPAKTQTKRTAPAWHLQTNVPAKRVTIARAAREEIDEFAWSVRASSWEGIESAAWLFGHGPDVSAVVPATGVRGRGYVEMNYEETRDHEDRLGLPLLGDLHVHAYGDAEASDDDRAAWREASRLLGRQYVGLIAASADQSWIKPEVRAWRVSRRAGRVVVEPVSLREGA